jgi:hypothetical protein
LLAFQPQLHIHCDWNKLDSIDWCYLIKRQPKLFKHCPLEKFTKEEQKNIVKAYRESL